MAYLLDRLKQELGKTGYAPALTERDNGCRKRSTI